MILCAGLCTLDILQRVSRYPGDNEKVTAVDQTVAAGGPATNAAVTAAHLGTPAVLVTAVGRHPLAAGIRADLSAAGVRLVDLAAGDPGAPPVSSIVASGGNRAVVSTNGAARALSVPDPARWLAGAAAVLVDGHYPELAVAVLRSARRLGIPTLLDAGSWKAVTPSLLPLADVVVCSADLRPPNATPDSTPARDAGPGPGATRAPGAASVPGAGPASARVVAETLAASGVRWIAISRGAEPILRWTGEGFREQPVPQPTVVDTLGAGDVLHGALAVAVAGRWPLTDGTFAAALDEAAAVASRSCASFGTRAWMR
ncbi:PfkB family carbohydrate kinase [Actinoplanes siamensis]|uniref:Kinase n=1 Tax=Actinoplanes siamensis TaxID=1223317 RepID=A0A919N7D2_9ACTN|nr:PfkB family carbohydrate kinase [Actinoplanes siamensis]GIF05700.1 kinase [Actinoplanes siamensis]